MDGIGAVEGAMDDNGDGVDDDIDGDDGWWGWCWDKDAGADCMVNDADDDTFFQEHV